MDTTIYTQVLPKNTVVMWYGQVDEKDPDKDLPKGWALCDGKARKDSSGSSITTPDLRSRFIVGAGQGDGLSRYTLGIPEKDKDGLEEVTLTTDQMPKHNHGGHTEKDGAHSHAIALRRSGPGHSSIPATSDGGNNNWNGATNHDGMHQHDIPSQGGGVAHENRPPYYALYFIMKIE